MESDYLDRTKNGTSFSGSDMNIFNAIVAAKALELYAKTGMKVTRNQTPSYLLQVATSYTGKKYKRGEYIKAAQDLTEYADALKAQPKIG